MPTPPTPKPAVGRQLKVPLPRGPGALRPGIGRHHLTQRARCLNGFTLIELLLVLALAAAVMAIVPPMIGAALPGIELKAAARRTAAGLRLAREEAIRSGHDAAVTIDLAERALQIDGDYRSVRLPRRIKLYLEIAESEQRDEQTGSIRFFPDGSSTGGIIRLARGESGYEVGVNWLTGRIRMAAWEAQ